MKFRIKGRRWVVVLLVLTFLLTQTALAELPVGGRRAAGETTVKPWDFVQKGTLLSITMDGSEEDQDVMDLVCDAFSVIIRQSSPDAMPGYLSYDVNLADETLVSYDVMFDEQALYLSSPFLGDKPVKLDFLAFEPFVAALEAYVASLEESGELGDLNDSYQGFSFEGMDLEAFQAFFEEAQADWDLEPIFQAFTEWFGQAWVGEPYDGEIASVYGVDISSTLIYDINKAEIVQLLETVIPVLLKQDAFLQDMALFMLSQGGYEPAEDEVEDTVLEWKAAMAAFPYVAAMNIPDDFAFYYNECYDANGNMIVGEIEFYLEQIYEPIRLYAEWLMEDPRLYIRLSNGDSVYGIDGWFNVDESDEAFSVDIGLDYSSYWQDDLENSFSYSIQMGTHYNELGQPDMDWTLHMSYADDYDSADIVYSLSGTTAVDKDNPGSINGYMTVTEGEDTVLDMQLLLESSMQPANDLPFDLNAEMYDVFNDTPEAFVQWLTVSIPEYMAVWQSEIQSKVDAYFEPLLPKDGM